MIEIQIIAGAPFQFYEPGPPVTVISFMPEDMRQGNLARSLPGWSDGLERLEKAGYIARVQKQETPCNEVVHEIPQVDGKPIRKSGRPPKVRK